MLYHFETLHPPKKLAASKTSVLLIDDDPESLELLQRVLEGADCVKALLAAGNGTDAIELLDTYRSEIGLLVLDWAMPDINGHDICLFVRARQTIEDLPILVLTALPIIDIKESMLAAGANYLMTKPFNPAKLKRIVTDCLVA